MTAEQEREAVTGELISRVHYRRIKEGLSLRQLSKKTGVSFSTLARVERGEGNYSPESARLLGIWLGDPVEYLAPRHLRQQFEELGRIAAASFEGEIRRIITNAVERGQHITGGNDEG